MPPEPNHIEVLTLIDGAVRVLIPNDSYTFWCTPRFGVRLKLEVVDGVHRLIAEGIQK